jgi:peptidoglycan/xylan/chitin deacetylase (PgdA/CDA1 family)
MSLTPRTCNSRPIPILTYHQIADAPPKGTGYRSLCVAPVDFERQMAFLSLMGYRGLSMTALEPYLRGERMGRVVGITLDDGYLNNLTHAAPVLQRYGFSATCYVVSQMLGKSNVWDRDAGVSDAALMDVSQLQRWIGCGQEVGAHTRNHARLLQLDASSAREEITRCKTELEDLLGGAVRHFCYPYGEYGGEHVAMAVEAGFTTATTTLRGRCQNQEEFMELPRVPIVRRTTRLAFLLKLVTAYEDRRRV